MYQSKVIVSMGYDSTTTNITLAEGYGAMLPDPSISSSYDLVWWNSTDYLNPADDPFVEIVKCIMKVGDTLIVIRSQQQTLASSKNIPNKLYSMTPLPGNVPNALSHYTLSYYNVPQIHDNTRHSVAYQTVSDVTSAIDTHASLTATHGATGTIVGTTNSQALTNKTITDPTNNVTARSLKSATTIVDVSPATAPTTGQVLTATSSITATWQSTIFTKGGTLINIDGIPNQALNVITWVAPFSCTVTALKGYRVGGTGATVNARKNGTSNHLASALSLTSADTWMDGGSVQNTAYSSGDKLEIMVVSTAGTVTQLGIQVNYTR